MYIASNNYAIHDSINKDFEEEQKIDYHNLEKDIFAKHIFMHNNDLITSF